MRKTMLASTAVLAAGLVVGFASPASAGQTVSGNHINIPVDVAVDVCGNALAVVGEAEAKCQTFIEALQKSSESGHGEHRAEGGDSIASGNHINIPVDVAVDVCGNALAVVGEAEAKCTTVVKALQEASDGEGDQTHEEAQDSEHADGSGDGILSNNEVNVPIGADVDVCGNTVSVLGSAEAECEESTRVSEGEETEETTETEVVEEGEDKPAAETETEAQESAASDDTLPVTGAALGGLVAAAVAALGGGGAAMYLARRKKAAAED